MPELPEVETVRAGVAGAVLGSAVTGVVVRGDRVLRRQVGGTAELRDVVLGARLTAAARRGKFLWFVLERAGAPTRSLLVHLGMSGQVLVRTDVARAEQRHLRLRLELTGGAPVALDLLDQRTFGYVYAGPLVPTPDGLPGGTGSQLAAVPEPVVHIARDLLDPYLDRDAVLARFGRRRSGVKRVLLDQTVVSGVGNIYADEALWRAGLHPENSSDTLSPREVSALLDAAEHVMRDALAEGGTTFDGLYVDVNGASGYFNRSLAVYGQAGRPCPRCGATVVRSAFMNRSSFTCPRCQGHARRDGMRRGAGEFSRMRSVAANVPPPASERSGDIAVMIVDDHEVVRRGIAEVVDRAEGMGVVAEAGSVAEGLRRATLVQPQVMLVDLQLPDGTGIDLLNALREQLPDTRSIVLTSFDDDDALAAALEAGAAAYLLKSVRGAEIADVVRSVAAGRTLLDERTITRRRADHEDPTADLTPSERKVLDLIGEGMSNREIAERLGVAEKTVKNHITSLLSKMGLQRRTQVAAWVAGRKHSAWRTEAPE